MKYLLGIDNGGTFSKAAIFDENGEQISVASVPTETLTPKPGYTEKNLDDLWDVNAQAIKMQLRKAESIRKKSQEFLFPEQEKAFIWLAMMENHPITGLCQLIQEPGSRWKNGMQMVQIKKFMKKHFRKFWLCSR